MLQKKHIAYDATNGKYAYFDSHEEATAWLRTAAEYDGISEETESGDSFIAQITRRTRFEKTDWKENYHEHDEDCPDDCNLEEWPHDDDFDYVGNVMFQAVH